MQNVTGDSENELNSSPYIGVISIDLRKYSMVHEQSKPKRQVAKKIIFVGNKQIVYKLKSFNKSNLLGEGNPKIKLSIKLLNTDLFSTEM